MKRIYLIVIVLFLLADSQLVSATTKTDSLVMAEFSKEFSFSPSIKSGQTKLELPKAPNGYRIDLIGTDRSPVISTDGKIATPLVDVDVNLLYQLVSEKGQGKLDLPTVTIKVPGQFEKSNGNSKPFVIPALQEWYGGKGDFQIKKHSRIIVLDQSDETRQVAELLKSDLLTYGYDLEISTDKPRTGDVTLSLNTTDSALGEEGYNLNIDHQFNISAFKKRGAIWGTRTLLQLLEQAGEKGNIPKGVSRDYPKYEVRGLVLDVARKFFTIDFLRDYVKMMSYYKMSEFHIHLNDNGFPQFFNNDWDKVYAAFRLENSTYPQLTAKDGHYSKKEFMDLQDLATDYGVIIIPEIDVPAHSLAISRVAPEIGSKKYGMDHLDLYNPKTYEVVSNIFKEYLSGDNPVFKGKVVHIGTDEYSKAEAEKFRYFTNYFIEYVQGFGKEARVWGALTHAKGKTPVAVNNVTMNAWYNGYAEPKDMAALGYKLISTPDRYLYIVPAAGYYYDYLNLKFLYRNWEPVNVGQATFQMGDPAIRGGSFAVWNDHSPAGTGLTEKDVHDRVFPGLQVLAQKMWTGTTDSISFEEFQAKKLKVHEGPGLNIAAKVGGKDSLVLHYSFDKANLKDQSTYRHSSLKKSNITLGKGQFGRSAKFAGGNSFIQFPVNEIGYNYTVSFWIKPDQNQQGEKILFSSPNAVVKSSTKNGKVGFSREGFEYEFNYSLPEGEWTNLVIVGNNKGTSLFVNGVWRERLQGNEISFLNTKSKVKKIETLVFPLQILGDKDNGFIGEIDEVKVFNKILSDKNIMRLYDNY